MRMIFKIAKTELQSLFYSPMAWLTLVVFTAMIGLVLAPMFENIVINQAMGYGARHVSSVYSQAYASILGYLYLFIPLLTMNVMSRDLSGGTIKLLQSSPLYPSQIILGKYLALMVFGLALMGIFVVYVIFGVFTIQNIDLPYILTGLLGLYLLYCAYVAIGLFVSSLTSYQVVAALGTLAILSVLNYVDMVWQGVDFIRDLTYWLSMKGRVNEFIAGLICSEDVLYFLFVPAMFLMWAILRLRNRIWRGSWSCRWGQYLGVLLTTLVLGYLSSRPVLMCYHDSTREKSQSLAVNTQKIVDLLDGGLTITTYTNVLEDDIFYTLPERINNDKQRFRNFVRFKPETKLEYKYFYADNGEDEMKQMKNRYPNLNLEEIAKLVCEERGLNFKRVLSPEEMENEVNLREEGFRSVRLIERENGKCTFLRFFEMGRGMRWPDVNENTLAGAYRRLAIDPPVIGFLSGHGSRSIEKNGERDYTRFSTDKYTESSMLNQGFDVVEVTLDEDIFDNVDILVVSALRAPLSKKEMENLKKYLDRGGNFVVFGEPTSTKWMNSITELFGVHFLDGSIVQFVGGFQPDFVQSLPSDEGAHFWDALMMIRQYEGCVAMPSCSGIAYSTTACSMVPLMISGADVNGWNELGTMDFENDTLIYEPEKGEQKGIFITAMALYRTIGQKEQRIVVFGDSDWASNVEMMNGRQGIYSMNNSLIRGLFRWMSYDTLPVSINIPNPIDNHLSVGEKGMEIWSIVFMGLLPLSLVVGGVVIQVRRRSR